MSILPYQEIRKRVIDDKLLSNVDIDKCLGPASYELRIGSIELIDGGSEKRLDIGEEFVMKPGASILIGTLEEVNLPPNLAGFLFLKSSLGRAGYVPWSQGLVDPGYQGSLTITLHNFAGNLRLFQGGQKICHLVFHTLTEATVNPYDGEYSNSKGATGSKERTPIVIGASSTNIFSSVLKIAGEESFRAVVGEGMHSILNTK